MKFIILKILQNSHFMIKLEANIALPFSPARPCLVIEFSSHYDGIRTAVVSVTLPILQDHNIIFASRLYCFGSFHSYWKAFRQAITTEVAAISHMTLPFSKTTNLHCNSWCEYYLVPL